MALIKCEECGQLVSDKASACPKCGAPVVRNEVCEECGVPISATDTVCPNCGCPKLNVPSIGTDKRCVIFAGTDYSNKGTSGKSRLAFCFLGWVFGLWGVHLFYIGKAGAGLFNIVAFILVAILEGVCYSKFMDSVNEASRYFYREPQYGLLFLMVIFLIPVVAIVIIYYYQLVRVALMTQEEFEKEYVYSDSSYPI